MEGIMFSKKEDPRVDKMSYDVESINKTIDEMKSTLVRLEEFRPVKSLVYGATALILIGVMGAALSIIGLS